MNEQYLSSKDRQLQVVVHTPRSSPSLRLTTEAKVWHCLAMLLENRINRFVRLMAAELNESVGLAV